MIDYEAEMAGTLILQTDDGLDKKALRDWMAESIADFSSPIGVIRFKGGQFNPT